MLLPEVVLTFKICTMRCEIHRATMYCLLECHIVARGWGLLIIHSFPHILNRVRLGLHLAMAAQLHVYIATG